MICRGLSTEICHRLKSRNSLGGWLRQEAGNLGIDLILPTRHGFWCLTRKRLNDPFPCLHRLALCRRSDCARRRYLFHTPRYRLTSECLAVLSDGRTQFERCGNPIKLIDETIGFRLSEESRQFVVSRTAGKILQTFDSLSRVHIAVLDSAGDVG